MAIVHGDGRLLFDNMTELLSASDIVTLQRRCLAGVRPGVARALAQALRHAAATGGQAAAAALSSGSAPLIFRLAALSADDARSFARAEQLHCLMIDDPAKPPWRDVAAAMRVYGLTCREATVGLRPHVAMLRDKLGVRSSLAVAAEMRRAASPFAASASVGGCTAVSRRRA